MNSPVLTAIHDRRSVREFTAASVERETLLRIVQAGVWAPSGLNNQPWRFVLVQDRGIRQQLAEQTHDREIVRAAPALIAVFLDPRAMYNPLKDHQSAGACLQNMLLAAAALGLGAVWLGQILHREKEVKEILALADDLELMAILALGHPGGRQPTSTRQELNHFIIKTF